MADDRDYSSALLLVEDDQNDVESTLAAWSEGVFIARDGEEALDYLLRRAAYRSQRRSASRRWGPTVAGCE